MYDEGKKFHFDTRYWEIPRKYNTISLYQVGDLSCKSGFEVGCHLQPCFEISYIVSGKGEFFLNKKAYPVKRGDIFLCLPNQEHNLIADLDDPFRYFYLAFFFNQTNDLENPFTHVEKMLLKMETPCIEDTQHIDVPFHCVVNELNAPNELSSQMLEAYMTQIIVLAYRNFHHNFLKKEHRPDSYTNEIVYAVISYIDNNIYEITSLTQIAQELNYSYSHLGHLFASEIGMSLQSYYNKKRIETAILLLREGKLDINKIALKLQYQSVHSFSKAFKKREGMSPGQYRSFLKKGDN